MTEIPPNIDIITAKVIGSVVGSIVALAAYPALSIKGVIYRLVVSLPCGYYFAVAVQDKFGLTDDPTHWVMSAMAASTVSWFILEGVIRITKTYQPPSKK